MRPELRHGRASEEDLAASFDVSRPVIREAVKELSLLGMVESRQGRATRVAPARSWNHFSPRLLAARGRVGAVDDILLELLELRRLIESGAAGLAATRASDEAIDEMAAAYDRMEASKDDVERFVDADIAFHEAVLNATGNYLLTLLIDMIGPLLRMGRRVSLERRIDGRTRQSTTRPCSTRSEPTTRWPPANSAPAPELDGGAAVERPRRLAIHLDGGRVAPGQAALYSSVSCHHWRSDVQRPRSSSAQTMMPSLTRSTGASSSTASRYDARQWATP